MVFRSYSQLFADIKNTDQIIANKLVAYNHSDRRRGTDLFEPYNSSLIVDRFENSNLYSLYHIDST